MTTSEPPDGPSWRRRTRSHPSRRTLRRAKESEGAEGAEAGDAIEAAVKTTKPKATKPKAKAKAKPKAKVKKATAAASTNSRISRQATARVNAKAQLTGIVAEPGSLQESNEASAAESRRNRRIARKSADTRKQTDSMKTYLKDIGTVSLLTGAEEVELAKRIQDLMYLNSVHERLFDEQGKEPSSFDWAIECNITEQDLERRLEEGKRAKNAMIQANLRLVVSIAKTVREQEHELPGSHPGGMRGFDSRRGEV